MERTRKLRRVEAERTPTLDESFPRRYEAEAKGRVATPDDLLYFPSRPVLGVEVKPKRGKAWSAAFGEDFGGFLTGLFTTPDDGTICVVCGGSGYFVETTDPERSWFRVECTPIRFVLPFPKHGVLVFGNFTDFVAYRLDADSIGVRLEVAWRSARLGWDDLAVTRATDDRIEGQTWHAPDDKMVGFSVDVRTGEHEGGAYSRGE